MQNFRRPLQSQPQGPPSECTARKTDARRLASQAVEALLRKPSAAAKTPRLRSLGLRSIPTGRKQMAEAKAVFFWSFGGSLEEGQKGSTSEADGSKQSAGLPLVDLAPTCLRHSTCLRHPTSLRQVDGGAALPRPRVGYRSELVPRVFAYCAA